MAVGDQDSGSVPVPAAVLLGGLNKPLDLPLGQIFAAAPANCYIHRQSQYPVCSLVKGGGFTRPNPHP